MIQAMWYSNTGSTKSRRPAMDCAQRKKNHAHGRICSSAGVERGTVIRSLLSFARDDDEAGFRIQHNRAGRMVQVSCRTGQNIHKVRDHRFRFGDRAVIM